MNKKEKMYAAIEKHGENLNAIFNTQFDNLTLCRKLFRLERKAHQATTNLCNTNTLHLNELNKYTGYDVRQATEEEQDEYFDAILDKVEKILKAKSKGIEIIVNHDPRGYALKIKNAEALTIHKDWGGYGILAPDFKG